MKKGLLINLLAISMVTMLLSGCGKETSVTEKESVAEGISEEATKEDDAASQETVDTAKEEEVSEDANEEATSEDVNDTQEEDVVEEVAEEIVIDRSSVFEMFGEMTSGWNLGNCLDAHGAGNANASETHWGNPKANQEMIDGVVAKGFNVIRIPITWAEHVGAAPEYAINPTWMDRVEEVVQYAYSKGVYVIIDTHHEPDYWMKPDEANADAVEAELVAIWKQVSERFKDYDEKLIFEGMNEPRMKGSAQEWNGGTAEERVLINRWNKAFVDTVRASGGNNATRVLIICPYGTSANMKAVKELEIPADNRIAVAIHMYTPYEFTYEQEVKGKDVSVWNGSARATIANTVKYLRQTLVEKDVPVIVTEYGAVNKENREEINKWVADYLGYMENAGIPCIWWDNGTFNTAGEKFAIYNRKECKWYAESTADAIMAAVGGAEE